MEQIDAGDEIKAERLVLTVAQVRRYLGLSLTSIYRALAKGEIPAERVGGSWLIPKVAFFSKFGGIDIADSPLDEIDGLSSTEAVAPDLTSDENMPPVESMLRSIEMNGKEYVTPKEAAKLLHCTDRYVRETHCANGDLRYWKKDREYFIELQSIYEFIDRSTQGYNAP